VPDATSERCRGCGAAHAAGAPAPACRAGFDRMLALEFELPAAFGPVHHLTVAAWQLQHPDGQTPAALHTWRAMVADALDGRATTDELRRRTGRRFVGPARVRDAAAVAPPWWPRRWPITAADAASPDDSSDDPSVGRDPAAHAHRVLQWAASVRATLDRAAPPPDARRP